MSRQLFKNEMTLLSSYLVQLEVTTHQSSAVLGVARSAAVIGPLFTGLVVDRLGSFRMALLAFLLTGVSFLILPSAPNWIVLMVFAFFAQFGMAMNKVCLRGLLFESVPHKFHKEALAWVRATTNIGALVAYGVASILALWWLPSIFYLDAITSLSALVLLLFLYGKKQNSSRSKSSKTDSKKVSPVLSQKHAITLLLLFSVLAFSWQLLYDLFAMGTPAVLEKMMPGTGTSLFSRLMLINTFLAGLLAVKAVSFFSQLRFALLTGVLCTAGGAALAHSSLSLPMLIAGTTIWSVGEVAFAVVCIFIMGRLTHETKKPGFWFAVSTAIMASGRMAAGVMIFPLIVNAGKPSVLFLGIGVVAVMLTGVFLWVSRSAGHLFESEAR